MAGGILQLITGSYDDYQQANYQQANHKYIKPKAKQKQSIKCFKKFKNFCKKDKYDQRNCCICLSKYKQEEYIALRFCGYIYHKDCADVKMIKCPICRKI